MAVVRPTTLGAALDALHEMPHAHVLAGGTDFMVEVNFGRRRPDAVVALRRVSELAGWQARNGELELGAMLTYAGMEGELAAHLPALAAAARTVGSPQIRNAGTLGGNLATGSPAADTVPLLVAMDAEVVLASRDGRRRLPLQDFVIGPKQTVLGAGELVAAVRVPRIRGPQIFLKVGPRNAMVIAVASVAVVCDLDARRVRCGLGAVSPRPLRPADAERFATEAVDWDALRVDAAAARRFGQLAAEASAPITDHRGAAEYRRHAIAVMAERALARALA